jgi:hypothetical protein
MVGMLIVDGTERNDGDGRGVEKAQEPRAPPCVPNRQQGPSDS